MKVFALISFRLIARFPFHFMVDFFSAFVQ